VRRPWEKLDDGSSAGTQGARQLELSQREPVRELQQSAGNRALLGLLSGSPVVQKKAKDSETAETTTAPAAPSLIVEDDAKEVSRQRRRALKLHRSHEKDPSVLALLSPKP
jgi:hypothetical protein